MSTVEVAEKLVGYCREGKNMDAINELYSDDVASVEPMMANGAPVKGKQAIIEKNQHWYSTVAEVHSAIISDPIVTGDFFACTMEMDVTYKAHGRLNMYEVAVYQVKDDKIVAEQFFYSM